MARPSDGHLKDMNDRVKELGDAHNKNVHNDRIDHEQRHINALISLTLHSMSQIINDLAKE